jgi:hypothetical protein
MRIAVVVLAFLGVAVKSNAGVTSLRPRGVIVRSFATSSAAPVAALASTPPGPPRTPPELAQCTEPLKATGTLPQTAGETVRYLIDIDGLSVGTIDFKIERVGSYKDKKDVTEYRSLFKVDSLVGGFVPVEGRAASLVGLSTHAPITATNRFRTDKNKFEEDVTYSDDGQSLTSTRIRNSDTKNDERSFNSPALDFVSAYYFMRSFPADTNGCALLYNNQRAYTVWVKYVGQEQVKTPVGKKTADKYELRYASESSKKIFNATMWLATDATRLPYKMRIEGEQALEARVRLYEVPPTKNAGQP